MAPDFEEADPIEQQIVDNGDDDDDQPPNVVSDQEIHDLDSKTSASDNAIVDDFQNGHGSEETIDQDTEMVSEDELPQVEQPQVEDAEEVSDDELPGPSLAELPADTEVVSEDELPASAKKDTNNKRKMDEGYDPGSPTTEETTEVVPEKKTKIEEEVAKELVDIKKKLPDLDKYWKAVNDDPADFTGWTYLLQYVDQEVSYRRSSSSKSCFIINFCFFSF